MSTLKHPNPAIPMTAPLDVEELEALRLKLRDRGAELRAKFVDGRGHSFKRDYPGWFNAFTEVLGLERDLTEKLPALLAAARENERLRAALQCVANEHICRTYSDWQQLCELAYNVLAATEKP